MDPRHILSCDWGTSNFRLRLIDTAARLCVAKIESDKGNALIFNEWKSQQVSDRVQFYLEYLKQAIDNLNVQDDLPVLISGMASSTVGMKELPYADLPFELNGTTAYAEWIAGAPVLNNPILLISGAHQPDDVMRGEETQLVGLSSLVDLPAQGESLFILPGTHSKHITVTNNRIIRFNTFMTGEMFDIISKYSILSHAVAAAPTGNEVSDNDKKCFYEGVKKSLASGLLSNLFSVRINQLKKYLSTEENYFYLSGVLIGSEIKHITNQNLILCSSGSLLRLYQWALDCAGLMKQTVVVAPDVLDYAAAAGQLRIYLNLLSKRS